MSESSGIDLAWSNFDEARKNKEDELISHLIKDFEENERRSTYAYLEDTMPAHTPHICNDNCPKKVINREFELYGCLKSGNTHRCLKNERCPSRMTGEYIICSFSGHVIDRIYNRAKYGKLRCEADSGNIKDLDTGYDQSDYGDGRDDVEDAAIAPNESELLICDIESAGISDFQVPTGNTLREKRLLKKAEKLENKMKEKKKIPKIQVKSMKGTKPRREFSNNNKHLIPDAAYIINALLFDQKSRVELNKKKEFAHRRDAKMAVQAYYKNCSKGDDPVRPCLLTADNIFAQHYNTHILLNVLRSDPDNTQKYSELILRLWNIIIKTKYFDEKHSTFHFKKHVMGTLYFLKIGYTTDVIHDDKTQRFVLIENDSFLASNLPHENDLQALTNDTYQKKDITDGRNILKLSLQSEIGQKPTLAALKKLKSRILGIR
jgi:hypothetical protein